MPIIFGLKHLKYESILSMHIYAALTLRWDIISICLCLSLPASSVRACVSGERTNAHWDKSPLGQKPTGQYPTGQKPTA